MLENLLKRGNCFKLVCGAGNEEIEEVKRLVYIYALAGCRFFDLSANKDVILAAKEALKETNINDAYLCVSVGIKGDPHSNKAVINYDRCVNCASCESICPQNAIHYAKVKKNKCIGCGRCWKVCPRSAISYVSEEKKLDEVLPEIIKEGIDCIEFHVVGQDENEIFSKWHYIKENFDGLLSICICRTKLSDEALIDRISRMTKDRQPYSTIIQADGFPMSGGKDDFQSTLQAVATSQIVNNANLPIYLLISGGTNSKTSELAKMCQIPYHGIAIGSYARKIVRKYIDRPDFWTNSYIIDEAIEIVKPLIESVSV
ncbi:4Fe-4S binding protein [bacterium]|nr:4Fe-4S binding protein [bacterium]